MNIKRAKTNGKQNKLTRVTARSPIDRAMANPTMVRVSSSHTRAEAPGSSGSLTKPPIDSMRSRSPGESGFYVIGTPTKIRRRSGTGRDGGARGIFVNKIALSEEGGELCSCVNCIALRRITAVFSFNLFFTIEHTSPSGRRAWNAQVGEGDDVGSMSCAYYRRDLLL